MSWGSNSKAQTRVPEGLTNVTAISAGWDFSLALGGTTPQYIAAQAQPQGLFTRELQWVITGILGLIGLEVLVWYLVVRRRREGVA